MQEENNPADILIIDDTVANLQILVSMLDQQGYNVRPINSGPLGLRAAQAVHPDLILLDIQMPDMDGFELCKRLKADEGTCHIPIIFISALDATRDKVKAFQMGGVDYITKPFQLEEVLVRVETHLEIQRLRRLDQKRIAEQARLIDELDAYAHTVAHDLKNPLAGISGFADILVIHGERLSAEKRQHFSKRILESIWRMNSIVDALLLLAKVRQQGEVKVTVLEMEVVVKEAMARLHVAVEEAEAEIVFPDVWPQALGYAPWVEEIWANYISNGIKYGKRPCHIELGADLLLDEGMVRFWVQDNGHGVTEEEQAKLFTPFTRLPHTEKIEGHGLGLSIVQRITERLAGSVGVESVLDQGSRFFFTLPAKNMISKG